MDKQTRILAGLFGGLIAVGVFSTTVYPAWIAPMLGIDEVIAERREELEKLETLELKVLDAKNEFRSFASRNGSFEWAKVEMNVRKHLDRLAARRGLTNVNVQQGRRRSVKKTDLNEVTISFKAEGTLQATVLFLKDVAEMPYVSLIESPAIRPGKRDWEVPDGYTLSMKVRTLVIPQHRLVGIIDESRLTQPEAFVRHEGNDYAAIWEHKPFHEDVVIPPLAVRAKEASVKVQEGRNAFLEVVVRGGDKKYIYEWTGSSGIDRTDIKKVRVITDGTGQRSHTCTVTDGHDNIASATFEVEVTEKPEPKRNTRGRNRDPKPEIPVDTGPKRWGDKRYRRLCMALIRTMRGERVAELMLHQEKSGETQYYSAGDDFDGGTLLYVHQTGVLVQRKDELYVYPIGGACNDDIPVDDATSFPRLQRAAVFVRDALAQAGGDKGAAASESGSDSESDSESNPNAPKRQPEGSNDKPGSTGSDLGSDVPKDPRDPEPSAVSKSDGLESVGHKSNMKRPPIPQEPSSAAGDESKAQPGQIKPSANKAGSESKASMEPKAKTGGDGGAPAVKKMQRSKKTGRRRIPSRTRPGTKKPAGKQE